MAFVLRLLRRIPYIEAVRAFLEQWGLWTYAQLAGATAMGLILAAWAWVESGPPYWALAMIGVGTAALVLSIMALAKFLRSPKESGESHPTATVPALDTKSANKDQILPKADTLDLSTSAEPPFNPSGLYVGQILVYAHQVETKGEITIKVCAFNATNCGLRLQSANGYVVMKEQVDGLVMWNLPPPRAELKYVDIVQNGTEFLIYLEQKIPSELMEKFASVKDANSLELSRGVKLRAGRKRTRFN